MEIVELIGTKKTGWILKRKYHKVTGVFKRVEGKYFRWNEIYNSFSKKPMDLKRWPKHKFRVRKVDTEIHPHPPVYHIPVI